MGKILERTYKIVRMLPDGQQVSVGAYEDVKKARNIIERLSEFWPGDYVIVPPSYEQRTAQ